VLENGDPFSFLIGRKLFPRSIYAGWILNVLFDLLAIIICPRSEISGIFAHLSSSILLRKSRYAWHV
jgi:hypothetical protein